MGKNIKKNRFGLKTLLTVFTMLFISVYQPSPSHPIILDNKLDDKVSDDKVSNDTSGIDTAVAPAGFRYVPGEVLVKFKKGTTGLQRNQYHTEVDAEVISEIHSLGVHRVRSRHGESTEALIARYKNNPFVEYAEPNGIFHITTTPNDPSFGLLWGLNNTGQTINGTTGTPGADIHAAAAWNLQTGSTNVVVADIDTGVDYMHPDLADNIWTNPGEISNNGIDDDGNGYIDDVRGWDFSQCAHFNSNGSCSPQNQKPRGPNTMDNNGHGTHTSGTIAAAGNNTVGVVGVNWRAKIMSVKWLNADGEGTFADAAAAIAYASQKGARISNNSWGCDGSYANCYSQTVDTAIGSAGGMLFVVAAGNGGADGIGDNNDAAVYSYPCNSTQPNVLCVAATDQYDHLASFSNYGAQNVDLGAPGTNILSTVPTGTCQSCSSSGYRYLNGTSMATPHVAGAAALLLAQNPSLTTDQLKNILINSVDLIPALSGKTVSGGRLNILKALQSIVINHPPSADGAIPVNIITAPGVAQSFTASYSDPDGFQDLSDGNFYIAGGGSGMQDQWIRYTRATNSFSLMGGSGSCSPGQAVTLSSSFLTLNCSASSASVSGTMLTVIFNLTPQAAFSGIQHTLLLFAFDQAGVFNFKIPGTWTINRPPSADGVSPVNVTTAPGVAQSFTATYSDPDGWQNLSDGSLYISGGSGGIQDQWVHYNPATNQFSLVGVSGSCVPGQATTLSNSYLNLNCSASGASGLGAALSVTFNVTPQPTFSGQHLLVIIATDRAGGTTAKIPGNWTIQ